ncbi:cytochrome c-type biogenesis protein [Halopseudomonas phragmitis]|uniref:Cytochrome c-type biogenesis protein n=1 Tax=Halopseudomonas phragmitis TaxID=1931241 RepID=A0A1V0B8F2_9GAMM|nr:cytochrome c-type biogenesis protein [Halopseudomonas phragmitis]AQZ96187.1 cytochrome c-type biogenesis protein CcmH [Halopseudomonas phragmitis]
MRKLLCALALLCVGALAHAAIDTYDFDSEDQRQRFYQISSELRCPLCQNQNIADSNAPIATDLRGEVYRLLDEGRTDKEIVEHMVARYGEFVRYRPVLTVETMVLWFAPAVFLLAGFVILLVMVRRRQKALNNAQASELDEQERERLQALLEKKTRDD